MAFDAERLSRDLGVDTAHVDHAQQLDPDALAENTALVAVDTAHLGTATLDIYEAATTLLSLQATEWDRFDPSDRAQVAVCLLGILRGLGLGPYDVRTEQ